MLLPVRYIYSAVHTRNTGVSMCKNLWYFNIIQVHIGTNKLRNNMGKLNYYYFYDYNEHNSRRPARNRDRYTRVKTIIFLYVILYIVWCLYYNIILRWRKPIISRYKHSGFDRPLNSSDTNAFRAYNLNYYCSRASSLFGILYIP